MFEGSKIDFSSFFVFAYQYTFLDNCVLWPAGLVALNKGRLKRFFFFRPLSSNLENRMSAFHAHPTC